MQDEPELLAAMIEDLLENAGIYKPGPFWEQYARRTRQAIECDGLADFRSNSRIGKGYADTAIVDPLDLLPIYHWKTRLLKQTRRLPVLKSLIKRYDRLNKKHLEQLQTFKSLYYTSTLESWLKDLLTKFELPDTLFGNPQQTLTIGGITIGEIYLRIFAWISDYSKVVDFSKVDGVFEIGGGFGAFAHTILHWFPNIKKYLYLDIPPILYVGTQYLKHFFGNDVIDYKVTRQLETIRFADNDRREIYAICPWQIEKVDAVIDFFWNSSSFQEMPAKVVSNYAKHIDRLFKKNRNARLGMFYYKGGKPEKMLPIEQLVNIFSSHVSLRCEELKTDIVDQVINGHSLIFECR